MYKNKNTNDKWSCLNCWTNYTSTNKLSVTLNNYGKGYYLWDTKSKTHVTCPNCNEDVFTICKY